MSLYLEIIELVRKRIKKYQEPKREIAWMSNKRTLHVVPMVVGLLGSVAKNLDKLGTRTNIHCSKNVGC